MNKYDKDKNIYERMALRYPALMEKTEETDFYIDEGWNDIVDALFLIICTPYQNAFYRWDAAVKFPRPEQPDEYIAECYKKLIEEKEKLPIIDEIKEKYAHLRVYVSNADERTRIAIAFAELISESTCEICGNKGYKDGIGWEKTYCKFHHHENGVLPDVEE